MIRSRLKRAAAEAGAPPSATQGPWRLPHELERGIPRPVELTGAGRAAVIGIALLIAGGVAAGVGLYSVGERSRARRARLERDGVNVEATVVRTGRTREKNPRSFVVYRYSAGGREYDRRVNVGRNYAASLEPGSAVTARYLPEDPALSWPAGYGPSGPPLWVAFVAPLGLWVFAPLVFRALSQQRRLLEEGRPAEAKVMSSTKVHGHNHTSYRVEYEFRTLSGAQKSVKLDSGRKPPATGSTVTLMYDPDNPRRAAVYPMCLVRVAGAFER